MNTGPRWAAHPTRQAPLHRDQDGGPYKAKIETPDGLRTCFEARIHRDGQEGPGSTVRRDPADGRRKAVITDRLPAPDYPRKELIGRLLTRQMRAMRATGTTVASTRSASSQTSADRDRASPRGRHSWPRRRRKTLMVCAACHDTIHAHPVTHAA